MPELVANCPRCRSARITFDVKHAIITGMQYSWQQWYEAFCVCRHCSRSTVFVLKQRHDSNYLAVQQAGLLQMAGALNRYIEIESFISIKDVAAASPPEHLPASIAAAFKEGASSLAIGNYNAAGCMFRLCIDLATRSKLPPPEPPVSGLNAKTRRDLGLRLPWLFDNGLLPAGLRELSSCIKEDGNDGAHAGTLTQEDAEDLLDFATALLERMYTEPERLRLAQERRNKRRMPPTTA